MIKTFFRCDSDPNKPWPRLEVVRRPKKDSALYFGPYHSASSARKTLRLVNRHFRLRTCTDSEFSNRSRPCLQFQIKRCPAPCVLDVDANEYAQQVKNVAQFLENRHDELIDDLRARMKSASADEEFERAAVYRDQIVAVERSRQTQSISKVNDLDQDAFGLHRSDDQALIVVLNVRRGRLQGVNTYPFSKMTLPNDEFLSSFLTDYYLDERPIPDEILLPLDIQLISGTSEMLSERRGKRVQLQVPRRGPKTRLIELAQQNAVHALDETRRTNEQIESKLARIQNRLRLSRIPETIECVDISHSSGTHTVSVLVRLTHGEVDRDAQRSFKLKHSAASDDYAAIYEVVLRRLRRGLANEEGWSLPDLLVVDGGKGQLRAAERALHDLGGADIELASIAKNDGNESGDRIFRPGWKNGVPVRGDHGLALLAMARDETHAASNRFRNRSQKAALFTSALDEIAGVGPKTRTRLLRSLGSVDAIAQATDDELLEAGASPKQVLAIREHWRRFAETEAVQNAFDEPTDSPSAT
ncbi:MAG: excinuclease ABC subunit UvrC [Polyangiales bacterium]